MTQPIDLVIAFVDNKNGFIFNKLNVKLKTRGVII